MSEEAKLLREIKSILIGLSLLALTGIAYLLAYVTGYPVVLSVIAIYGSYFTVPLSIWFIVRGWLGRCH